MPSFKAKLRDTKQRLTMHICTIPSAVVTQAMAAAGADGVIIDFEHGAIGHEAAHAMIAATAGTDCAPMVRVQENREELVKRALDLGAEGIVFPLIRTAEDAERAVASMRYPPNGTRGFGPFIAHSRWNTTLMEYREALEPHLVCVLLIETEEAVANIDAICAVPGIDMIVPAQFDLSTALGISGQFDHPDFKNAVSRIEKAALSAGIPLGQAAVNKAQAENHFANGYRVIAGFDALCIRGVAAEMAAWAH